MRIRKFLIALYLSACGASFSAEPAPAWPLWDGQESVAAYAQRTGLAPEKSIDLGGGVKLELVLIPAGRYVMGTPEPRKPEFTVLSAQVLIGAGGLTALALLALLFIRKRAGRRFAFSLSWLLAFCLACSVMVWGGALWHLAVVRLREYRKAIGLFNQQNTAEKPAHPKLIPEPFYMGRYIVTQEQYQAIMGENPSHYKGPRNPVENVSWNDDCQFCEKVKLKTGAAVSLPTEAQWEYACRAGTTTRFYSGDSDSDLDRVGWYSSNSGSSTHPVGQKLPNAFGLYDMHGNVYQWCLDAYHEYEKPFNLLEDPSISSERKAYNPKGIIRAFRGGAWYIDPAYCTSAYRCGDRRDYPESEVGFRVVMPAPPLETPP